MTLGSYASRLHVFILNMYYSMADICDRLWENRPHRVIDIQGLCRLKAIICGIFFVMEVTRCGSLAVSVQSLMAYRFKTKSRKI